MKKIFTLIVVMMAVMSVSAQTKLTLGGQSANGNWSWGTSQEIGSAVSLNFSSQWGEFTLASAPGTATGCKLVVAEANSKINLVVKYSDGSDTQYIGVDANEKDVTFTTANASLVELQGTEAGEVIDVKSFVLVGSDGTETQTTYATNWGVSMYGGKYTCTSQWGQIMLNGAEQTEPQILKFYANSAIPENVQLKVIKTDDTEAYPVVTPGATTAEVTLDYAVKEASIQFSTVGTVLDLAYVTTEPASATSINTVSAVAASKVYKTIENGQVVIVKNGNKFSTAGQLLK